MKWCLGPTRGTSLWSHTQEVQELESVSRNAFNAWFSS